MAYSKKMYCKMPEKLFLEIKTMKKTYALTWSDFIINLFNKHSRPRKIINLKLKYNSKKTKLLTIRISDQAWLDFVTFSVPFTTYVHTWDYIITKEKESMSFVNLTDGNYA